MYALIIAKNVENRLITTWIEENTPCITSASDIRSLPIVSTINSVPRSTLTKSYRDRQLGRRPRRIGESRQASPTPHHRRRQMFDRWRPGLLHCGAQLRAQDLEHALDTGLAERAETPQIGPADTYGSCPHRQGLDDVGAAPKSAVRQHGHPAADRREDFRERLDGGSAAV